MRNTRHGKDFRRLAALLLSMALLLTDATLVNAAEAAVNAPAVSPEGTMDFSVPEDTGDGDQKETTDPSEQAVSPDGAEGEGQEGSTASPAPTDPSDPDTQDPAADGNGTEIGRAHV